MHEILDYLNDFRTTVIRETENVTTGQRACDACFKEDSDSVS